MTIKITTNQTLEDRLRDQLNYLRIEETMGGLVRTSWVKIGTTTTDDILSKNTIYHNNNEDWIKFIGFSRIDERPIFFIPPGAVDRVINIEEYLQRKGLTTITEYGNATHYLEGEMTIDIIIPLVDNINGYRTYRKSYYKETKGQRFTDEDPYGEEDWEN